ncbi:MAG: lipid-binding SYLF domain-containing protein [Bacillota bacterium]
MRTGHLHRVASALICILLILPVGFSASATASSPLERLSEALHVLKEMSQQDDVGTMARLLEKAKGVAIFPSVVKASLGIGARYGKGLVLRRDSATGGWYGPGFIEITGLSWGFQAGVQSTALVLVITNENGMRAFEGGKITLGGELAVAAGPVGRHAEAGTDLDFKASIYSYSMSRGAFAGISLEGAKIDPDEPANELYWGSALSPGEILARKAADNRAKPLIQELNRLIAEAR